MNKICTWYGTNFLIEKERREIKALAKEAPTEGAER